MNRNSYTSTERRGIIAIAIISLLIVGAGLGVSFCTDRRAMEEMNSIVEEHTEYIDSTAQEKNSPGNKKEKGKSGNKKTKGKSSSRDSNQRPKKVYPTRSPLDEPV